MLIEKVQTYEGDEGPVKELEGQLEKHREYLRSIGRYGLQGLGAPELRFVLAQRICVVKQELITMGAYKEGRYTEYQSFMGKLR